MESKFNKTFKQFLTEASGLDLGEALNAVFDAKQLQDKQAALLELLKKLKKPTKANKAEIDILQKVVNGDQLDTNNIPSMFKQLFDEKSIDKYATNVVLKGQGMGTH